jgi:hypothetical protein
VANSIDSRTQSLTGRQVLDGGREELIDLHDALSVLLQGRVWHHT